jgi:hypothetical protein
MIKEDDKKRIFKYTAAVQTVRVAETALNPLLNAVQ